LCGAGMVDEGQDSGQARYMEIARFLRSVRPTLESLYFEQGTYQNGPGWSLADARRITGGRPGTSVWTGCFMDETFARVILLAMMEAPWPFLGRVEIRGAGRWTDFRMTRDPEYQRFLVNAHPVQNLIGPLYRIEEYPRCYTLFGYTIDAMEVIRARLGDNLETLIIEPDPLRDYDYAGYTGILESANSYGDPGYEINECPRCDASYLLSREPPWYWDVPREIIPTFNSPLLHLSQSEISLACLSGDVAFFVKIEVSSSPDANILNQNI
jgi:hypothetical protein